MCTAKEEDVDKQEDTLRVAVRESAEIADAGGSGAGTAIVSKPKARPNNRVVAYTLSLNTAHACTCVVIPWMAGHIIKFVATTSLDMILLLCRCVAVFIGTKKSSTSGFKSRG